MTEKKAFLFDLNGTMIDDMEYHIIAWYDKLNKLGAPISMQRMKEECYGKNDELLERIFPGRFSDDEVTRMSAEKEADYRALCKPNLALLPGLDLFLEQAKRQNIQMAIGSAAIRLNIDFVLDNLNLRSYFTVIVGAEDVPVSKPNPETFLSCARQLNVHPADCVVFEDSPKGVQSALAAGMDCIVITTLHEAFEFEEYSNVLMCVRDYTDAQLERWLQSITD